MLQGPFPIPPLSTVALFASANNFTGEISESICRLSTIMFLDLSRNNFSGRVPRCLGNLSSYLQVLILRENNLMGRLPKIRSDYLTILDVGHNKLAGKLPKSLIHCKALQVLNVESNNFNDTFPFWSTSMPSLRVVVLRSNKFHGSVFPSKGNSLEFIELRILDLSHNRFTRVLPSHYFANWSAMSSIGTHEDQTKVKYIGYNTVYYHMVLTTKGVTTKLERVITTYTIVDLSGNRFSGNIPESVGLLKDLVVLSLSDNAFTGHIPSSLANLTELESLDLSLNKLSGEIPSELKSLTFLGYMNFSHNQLEGPIPQVTQFITQNKSSFEGNLGLYSCPLDESCGGTNSPTTQESKGTRGGEEEEENISWMEVAISFGPGVVFGLVIGHIFAWYKHEWIMKISSCINHRRS